MSDAARGAGTGDLVRQAAEQISRLVRDELALARVEMVQKGKRAGTGAGLLGGGGVIALFGLAALLTAAGLALAEALPGWLSALIVAAALFAVAGVLALAGRRQVARGVPPVPREAAGSLRADLGEVREKVHR
ncbi:phage holin family protein [Phytohabitans sp. ZYX-F-186]|uniref:Phage holin family protein n=1 Tax=Phytohabitans maris TaxID=3071409 RepID=A0ABU0ZM77_9ACTN|nr:phage holin family protein [Phytohabitans sp. ZYX-F-186]MDQ7908142.1 phage holin family protein [Phytohabitans sp. ZYX-F-186]